MIGLYRLSMRMALPGPWALVCVVVLVFLYFFRLKKNVRTVMSDSHSYE